MPLAITTDGQWFATRDRRGRVSLEGRNAKRTEWTTDLAAEGGAAFSADGASLAFVSAGAVVVLDSADGAVRHTIQGAGGLPRGGEGNWQINWENPGSLLVSDPGVPAGSGVARCDVAARTCAGVRSDTAGGQGVLVLPRP